VRRGLEARESDPDRMRILPDPLPVACPASRRLSFAHRPMTAFDDALAKAKRLVADIEANER
jgi:hypothetical protein